VHQLQEWNPPEGLPPSESVRRICSNRLFRYECQHQLVDENLQWICQACGHSQSDPPQQEYHCQSHHNVRHLPSSQSPECCQSSDVHHLPSSGHQLHCPSDVHQLPYSSYLDPEQHHQEHGLPSWTAPYDWE